MEISVIVFPGSNCDRDVAVSLKKVFKRNPKMVWHKEQTLPKSDLIVLPGGFSYGDYLRCGSMAANSPIMSEIIKCGENLSLIHISEPTRRTPISYAVFCLKKKK